MIALKDIRTFFLICSAVFALQPLQVFALSSLEAPRIAAQQTSNQRDGQHDFDFEIGAWKTHIKRLQHPLTGSTTWSEYDGTTVVQKVWDGRANLVELEVDGPAGHIEALSLRLYNPQSHQWSLNFANSRVGSIGNPTIGEFKNGRGEFLDQEVFNDRTILNRFIISDITPNSCHFEQAFSDDEGKTWEVNWVATDTRVNDEPNTGAGTASVQKMLPGSGAGRQLLSDAWWTGSILAALGGVLSSGQMLIDPYFYDVRGDHTNAFGLQATFSTGWRMPSGIFDNRSIPASHNTKASTTQEWQSTLSVDTLHNTLR
jgi:hypothetical protein